MRPVSPNKQGAPFGARDSQTQEAHCAESIHQTPSDVCSEGNPNF